MATGFGAKLVETDGRIEKVEAQLEALEKRLDAQLEALEKRLEARTAELAALVSSARSVLTDELAGHAGRLEKIERTWLDRVRETLGR